MEADDMYAVATLNGNSRKKKRNKSESKTNFHILFAAKRGQFYFFIRLFSVHQRGTDCVSLCKAYTMRFS